VNYDKRRRRLNRRGDEAMDDLRYAADSFNRALQPRGCVIAILFCLAAWAGVLLVVAEVVA
jgi:hypothetical protein